MSLGTVYKQAHRMLKILAMSLFEVRLLPSSSASDPVPKRCYCSSAHEAAKLIEDCDSSSDVAATYVTIHEISKEFSGVVSDYYEFDQGFFTKDAMITKYCILFFDIDPVRKDGSKGMATEEEKQSAIAVADKIVELTKQLGWAEPLVMDSGNGVYVIFGISLDNTPENQDLYARVLHAMAGRVDTKDAHVDTCVHNPSRIIRVAGSLNRKGESTEDRPHRMAQIISAPEDDKLEEVSIEKLQQLAAEYTGKVATPKVPKAKPVDAEQQKLANDVHDELVQAVIKYLPKEDFPSWTVNKKHDFTAVEFDYCPFKGPEHTDGSPAVLVYKDGTIAFKCFHEKCSGKGWAQLQTKIGRDFDPSVVETMATFNVTGQIKRYFFDPFLLAQRHAKKWMYKQSILSTAHFWGKMHRYDPIDNWQTTSLHELRPWIRTTIQESFDSVARFCSKSTGRRVRPRLVTCDAAANAYAALESISCRSVSVNEQPPFWLGEPHLDWNAKDLLPCGNKILNVRKFVERREEFTIPHTPRLFYSHRTPFCIDMGAPQPKTWFNFLSSLGQDEKWRQLLQEIMGYVLWQDYNLQKFFQFVGPTRAGKGVIFGVMSDMVGGDSAVCSLDLDKFVSTHGLEDVPGKQLILVAEAESDIRDTSNKLGKKIAAKIKAITGGDPVSINPKHNKHITTRVWGKIVLVTNEFLALPDNSGALNARLIPLKFTKSFRGKENHELSKELAEEYPAILNWCLEGVRRLYEAKGVFTLPESTQVEMDQILRESAPLKTFLEQCCNVGETLAVQKKALYKTYKAWATNGDGQLMNDVNFAAELRSTEHAISEQRAGSSNATTYKGNPIISTPYDEKDGRPLLWVGIAPKPHADFLAL